ncbi:MAG: hypothetical protein ACYCW6_32240 [Candidatus Xenobia bacterium]
MKSEWCVLMVAIALSAFSLGYWKGRDSPRPPLVSMPPVPSPTRTPAAPVPTVAATPVRKVPRPRPVSVSHQVAQVATPIPHVTVTVYPTSPPPSVTAPEPMAVTPPATPTPRPMPPLVVSTPVRNNIDYDDDLPAAGGPCGQMGGRPGGVMPGSQWDGRTYPTLQQRPSNLPDNLAWPPTGWTPPHPPPPDYAPYFPPPPNGGGSGPPGGRAPPGM